MINHRHEFAKLGTPTSVAVEVGTDRGIFAAQFMRHGWQGELVCVDNWQPYDEMPGTRVPDMMMAVMALMPWHGRVHMLQCDSIEAATNFPWWLKPRIDFVYIDAAHTYSAVRLDIELWWPLVKKGGVLAGHDYASSHTGVVTAVDDFVRVNELELRVTRGDDIPSWYVVKPQ